MKFSLEEFKKYNAYFLHLKYPERCADDNWLHTCEILNRINFYKTYLSLYFNNRDISSTREWYKHFTLEMENGTLEVKIQDSVTIINIPLPLELPKFNENKTQIIDNSGLRKIVIEN